jgi:hypothetical protein
LNVNADIRTIESFLVSDILVPTKINFSDFSVGDIQILNLGFSPIHYLEKINYSISRAEQLDFCPLQLNNLGVKTKKEFSVLATVENDTFVSLNNLKITYSSNIINYVNIINSEEIYLSLSKLEIRDKINFYQNLSFLERIDISLNNIEYNKKYTVGIESIDVQEVMLFHNLLGLKFADLDGLKFIDLMFN